MGWLSLVFVLIVVAVGVARRLDSSATPPAKPRPSPPPSLTEIEAQMLGEIEAEAARLMPEIEATAGKLHAEAQRASGEDTALLKGEQDSGPRGAHGGPSWMSTEEWESRLVAYRRQGRSDARIADVASHLEERGPKPPRDKSKGRSVPRSADGGVSGSGIGGMVYREDYVPKENEAHYLTRDADGVLTLRLADAGDRLVLWSPVDGGALINPKGPGLRSIGLYSSYARGADYHASAYRTADLRKGSWVELRREPDNAHDKNAVAMYAPGARPTFAYVQRGRGPAVARRIDAGEDMAAVSMRGPGPGRDDDTTFVLIGSRADLTAMLAD